MPGVEAVLEVLESAGFERLPKPLVVAGTSFDFDAAVKGTGTSHDLVVVVVGMFAVAEVLRSLKARRPPLAFSASMIRSVRGAIRA